MAWPLVVELSFFCGFLNLTVSMRSELSGRTATSRLDSDKVATWDRIYIKIKVQHISLIIVCIYKFCNVSHIQKFIIKNLLHLMKIHYGFGTT